MFQKTGEGKSLVGSRLTTRELQCLHWVQVGKSSSDIGQLLELSPRTVDTYVARACARLDVRTRTQAVVLALTRGLLAPASR